MARRLPGIEDVELVEVERRRLEERYLIIPERCVRVVEERVPSKLCRVFILRRFRKGSHLREQAMAGCTPVVIKLHRLWAT